MKQLGPLDSAFINLENSNTPQHVGGVGIYDPSTSAQGFVRFKDVIKNFEQRFQAMPLFRTRLVTVPGKIDRPYWVVDKNFDMEFHLRHIALPEPGDWRQLWIQVARLHARSLDMSRPLWETYIIEGLDKIPNLPKGAFAVYTKMHHSLVDGGGGEAFMAAIHDLEPDPAPRPREQTTIIVDRQPTTAELLTRALLNNAKNTVGLTTGFFKVAADVAKYGIGVARGDIPSPDISAPRSRFNNPVGPHRVAEAAVFSLDDFKAIKNAVGVTINDVAIGVVSGAMRRYLQHYNELPEESLAAGIPLNMRTRREQTDENNQVGTMFAAIHTNIDDPIERLKMVHESTELAKESNAANPLVDVLKIAGVFPPAVAQPAAGFWRRNEIGKYSPANVTTTITNVMGPNFSVYCAGARMVRYHALGLLTPGVGLFHAVFSNDGVVTLTILADRSSMPDPEFYRHCLEQSFKETKDAALRKKASKKPVDKRRATGASKAGPKKIAARAQVTSAGGSTALRVEAHPLNSLPSAAIGASVLTVHSPLSVCSTTERCRC